MAETAIEIIQAFEGADLDAVRDLCRAFRQGQFERYADQFERIDRYYGAEEFERTLQNLPRLHAPPKGLILLARVGAEAAGCVMFAPVDDRTCEMKRMFVAPGFRGLGVARALGKALLAGARKSGYGIVRLDTGPRQSEAVALYESLGFTPCAPYKEDGPIWPDKVYMMRKLETLEG